MSLHGSTRQRLLDEGMKLFARNGFAATSVGEIEAAVGLRPRRGALYKHFESKQALLDEALRFHLDRAATAALELTNLDFTMFDMGNPEAVRAVVESLGRWFLEEFDRMEDLTRLIEHEGSRIAGFAANVKSDVVDLSYRSASTLIAALAPKVSDPDAQSVVLLGALVAFRRTAWTFGQPPLDIDDQRVLDAWGALTLTLLDLTGSAA